MVFCNNCKFVKSREGLSFYYNFHVCGFDKKIVKTIQYDYFSAKYVKEFVECGIKNKDNDCNDFKPNFKYFFGAIYNTILLRFSKDIKIVKIIK